MNCKPGDLAIVIGSTAIENIGRIVQVVRPAVRAVDFDEASPKGFVWVVRADRPLARQDVFLRSIEPSLERAYFDDLLRPITGLPITDDIKDEEVA